MRNPNPYPRILKNYNLFKLNPEVSTGCFYDDTMCKSVEKSDLGSNKEISPHSAHRRPLIL